MQQITKAMKMVAASKLRKSQEKVIASRPYAKQMQDALARLVQAQTDVCHPLLEKRPVKKVAYILFTSDRGLCGGFNANLIRTTRVILEEPGEAKIGLVVIGRKGDEYFGRGRAEVIQKFTGLGDKPDYNQAKQIAKEVIKMYEAGEVDEVSIVYSKFVSVLNQVPTVTKLLPIESVEGEVGGQYIFEPSPAEMINRLLPRYIETLLYSALIESKASEFGAKMTAMDSATENASEMIDKLTLAMNRARQAAITTEISEIVGGAAALG